MNKITIDSLEEAVRELDSQTERIKEHLDVTIKLRTLAKDMLAELYRIRERELKQQVSL